MSKNRYIRRAKVSEAKFRQFLRYFAMDIEATKLALLTSLNRNTANRLAKALRQRIAEECDREAGSRLPRAGQADPWLFVQPDSTKRFAGRAVQGWILPDGRVHTQLVPSLAAQGLAGTKPESPWPAVAFLNLVSPGGVATIPCQTRAEVQTNTTKATNVFDNFWGLAKLRLSKFKGTSPRTFQLHLKECEFRFNHRREDLYRVLLNLVRTHPL